MSLTLASRLLEILLGLSLLVQTIEYLRLMPLTQSGSVWDWEFQRLDIPLSMKRVHRFLAYCYREPQFKAILCLRLLLALSLIFFGVNLYSAWILLLSNLLLLIRWRGAFNGGSDFMTLVLTCALTLGQTWSIWGGQAMGWVAALWYVSIHSITSYFMSGWVKLLNKSWRSGLCMPVFLDSGVFGPLSARSVLAQKPVAILCSWSFILWEACMPAALISPKLAWCFCACAVVFHFLVFWFFGLNRFFWAWLASLPAILYCSTWNW
jgi:hypothetical protein